MLARDNVFRISRLPEVQFSKPNRLYLAIEDLVDENIMKSLHEGEAEDVAFNSSLELNNIIYTTRRLSEYSQENFKTLISRLPTDIQDLAYSNDIGPLEADIIDFLLNYVSNQMLTVVGSIGVGKSSLMRYILFYIRNQSISLQGVIPLYMNLLRLGTNSPYEQDVLREFTYVVENSIENTELSLSLDKIRESLSSGCSRETARVMLLDYCQSISQLYEDKIIALVFDNTDQMSPESTSVVLDVARAIHMQNKNFRIIVAVRPSSYRTKIELSRNKGSYLCLTINVTPPDLRFVIKNRLELIKSKLPDMRNRLTIPFGDIGISFETVQDAIEKIANFIMDDIEIQAVVCNGLCNSSIRHSLLALNYFLRYRNLDIDSILSGLLKEEQGLQLTRNERNIPRYDLIHGIMIAARKYYSERENLIIPNLYIFDEKNHFRSYTIQFIILELLDWSDGIILTKNIIDDAEYFGFSRRMILDVIRKLINYRLVISPESENESTYPINIVISQSGRYYMKEMISNPDYLYNIVYDTPLEHTGWHGVEKDNYECHIKSLADLLLILINADRGQVLELKLRDYKNWASLGALQKNGILSRRLMHGMNSLIEHGLSSSWKATNTAANKFKSTLANMDKEVEEIETSLNNLLYYEPSYNTEDTLRKESHAKLHENCQIYVNWPEEVRPGTRNNIDVELVGDDLKRINEPVSVFCRFDGAKMRPKDWLIQLTDPDDTQCLSGSFTLDDVNEIKTLPSFRLDVMVGAAALGRLTVENG